MAGAEIWTACRDWVSGETVTQNHLNQQVRDNLTYLKGVLSGSSLQAVTIAAAQLFKWGSLRVIRGSPSATQHLEKGFTYHGSPGGDTVSDVAVSFETNYSGVPSVVCNPVISSGLGSTSAGTVEFVDAIPINVTSTGFTLRARTRTGIQITNLYCNWIALGNDS